MSAKILVLLAIAALASSQATDDNMDILNFIETEPEIEEEASDIPAMMNGTLPIKFKMMSNTQVTIFFSVAGGVFLLMVTFSFFAAMFDVGKTMNSGMKPRTHA